MKLKKGWDAYLSRRTWWVGCHLYSMVFVC